MGISLSLKIDVFVANSEKEEMARAYVSGVASGLNLAEYLIESGVRTLSSKAYMYIVSNRETEILLPELVLNLSDLISVRVKEKWFCGSEYMGTELQSHYIHGLLEGYGSIYSILGETKNQTGSYAEAIKLTERFIYRVRNHIDSLN